MDPNRPIQDIDLSDEEVTEILDRLDADEGDTSETTRRTPRRFLRGTALVLRLSLPGFATADYRVRLRNVSRHGVAFLSRYRWESGTRLNLQMPIGPELSIVEKQAVVVRCRSVVDPIFEIGAEFQDTL